MYSLGKRSKDNLFGVHPSLMAVVQLAIQKTEQDFTVIEGLRTHERQKELYELGASQTMKSRHLVQSDGYSHAVDIYPYYKSADFPNGSVHVSKSSDEDAATFQQRWYAIAKAMDDAADELGVKITWGGRWKTFVDMPHYQIEV